MLFPPWKCSGVGLLGSLWVGDLSPPALCTHSQMQMNKKKLNTGSLISLLSAALELREEARVCQS